MQICEGIIIRITPPLIWIEISSDTITVLPYNSTDIYPLGWCNNNGIEAINLLTENKKSKPSKQVSDDIKAENIDEDSNSNIPGSPSSIRIIHFSL